MIDAGYWENDLEPFRVLSKHPNCKWICCAGKPQESAVYCFYEISMESVCQNLYVKCHDQVAYSQHVRRMTL